MDRTHELAPARHLLATCQHGAEQAVQHDLLHSIGHGTAGFFRPGFVTWKLAKPLPATEALATARSCFARTLAVSLGFVDGEHSAELTRSVWELLAETGLTSPEASPQLHVWQRDWLPAGARGFYPHHTPLAASVKRALTDAAPIDVHDSNSESNDNCMLAVPTGRWVIDVVIVEPSQWWIGYHRAESLPQRWPGGIIRLPTKHSPISRAYFKTVEALKWSRLPIAKGDLCAELGCAPGGSSEALLERGVRILGIDPAEVDGRVLENNRFTHLRRRVREVRLRDFQHVRWLFADLNVAPNYTLDAVEDIVGHWRNHIRGLVLTLKLPNWGLAEELPGCVDRVRTWGYSDVRMRQLSSAGREVCLVALRSRAQRRIRRTNSRSRKSSVQENAPIPTVD